MKTVKQMRSLALTVILVLSLCACGGKSVSAWQEQYDLGVRYLSDGNYEEAIIAFTAAIEIDEKRPEAYRALADAYVAAGDPENAQDILEQGFTITGDISLQSRLKELSAPPDVPEEILTAGEQVSGDAIKLTDISCRYEAGNTWGTNEGAVGYMYISAAAQGPETLRDILIGTWWLADLNMDEQWVHEAINQMTGIWREANIDLSGARNHMIEQAFPVYPDNLNTTVNVLLIGIDSDCNAVGYTIVRVPIPE